VNVLNCQKSEYSAFTNSGKRIELNFQVPCCPSCIQHWDRKDEWHDFKLLYAGLPACVGGIGIGLGCYALLGYDFWPIIAILSGSYLFIAIRWILERKYHNREVPITPACTTVGQPVECRDIKWFHHATSPSITEFRFWFTNDEYAEQFDEANKPHSLQAAALAESTADSNFLSSMPKPNVSAQELSEILEHRSRRCRACGAIVGEGIELCFQCRSGRP
jgi:hypothetical protein